MGMTGGAGIHKLPMIFQTEKSECALACLAMVLTYFGHKIDINTLRNKYGQSQHGVSLKTLLKVAERVNLTGRPLRLEMTELKKLKLPAILHWDLDHFVVLKKMGRLHVLIHDPALGEISHDLQSVDKHFTGVAVEFTPGIEFEVVNEEQKLKFSALWHKSEGLLRSFFQLLLLSLLLQLFSLALPFYTQLFIDDVLVSQDFDLLKILAIGFFMITL